MEIKQRVHALGTQRKIIPFSLNLVLRITRNMKMGEDEGDEDSQAGPGEQRVPPGAATSVSCSVGHKGECVGAGTVTAENPGSFQKRASFFLQDYENNPVLSKLLFLREPCDQKQRLLIDVGKPISGQ